MAACHKGDAVSATTSHPTSSPPFGTTFLVANDDLIAGMLNRNKLATGLDNRWTRERVRPLRSHHRIPVHNLADDGIEPWLNLTKAAAYLGISAKTLRLAAASAAMEALHPLSDGPRSLAVPRSTELALTN